MLNEEKKQTQQKIEKELEEKSSELNSYFGKPEGTFSVVPEEEFYKELYNTYPDPEVAKDLLIHAFGMKSGIGGYPSETDWIYTMRTFLTTGNRKEPDDVFGTLGCRMWWIMFKAPNDVLPLLINDPAPCGAIALWRIRYGKPQTDEKAKERIKQRFQNPNDVNIWIGAAERMRQILLRQNGQ